MAKLFAFIAGAGRRQFGSVMPSSPLTFDVAVVDAGVYPRPLGPITHLFGPFLLGAEPIGEHVLAAPPGDVHKRSTAAPPMHP
jgi:hypothetical protein